MECKSSSGEDGLNEAASALNTWNGCTCYRGIGGVDLIGAVGSTRGTIFSLQPWSFSRGVPVIIIPK